MSVRLGTVIGPLKFHGGESAPAGAALASGIISILFDMLAASPDCTEGSGLWLLGSCRQRKAFQAGLCMCCTLWRYIHTQCRAKQMPKRSLD